MKARHASASPRALPLALVFLSGVAGLGYEMTWIRLFSAGLGHEVPAMVAVLAAFLGGMALGAAAVDRRSPALDVALAARWFARVELLIGAWGALSAWLIPAANRAALDLLGPAPALAWHWSVVFALPFATLLPATAAMGATLPILVRTFHPLWPQGRCVGALYFVNTFGAATGTLGGTFFLMPSVGLRGSLVCLAAINILVGLVALRIAPRLTRPAASPGPQVRRAPEGNPDGSWLLLAGAGGFLGIAFELAGVRGLSQVLENTVYTFAAVLAVHLGGMALGAAWFQRALGHLGPRVLMNRLLVALSGSALVAGAALRVTPVLHQQLRALCGDSLAGVLLAELGVTLTVFGPPTFLMGALFSLAVQASAQARGSAGRAYMWNTLGCGLAAVVVTLWLVPGAGVGGTLLFIAGGYLSCLRPVGRTDWWLPTIPVVLAVVLFPGRLTLVQVPEGTRVVEIREGVLATATVLKSADGNRTLRVNNRLQMGGTASTNAQYREAHLPLLLHPAPRTALFLGPGTGITLGAATRHPGLAITAVELLPEVIALMPRFAPENGGSFTNAGCPAPVHAADARRFVRTTASRYDVIVADLFHPAQDGAGFLYTREHFQAVRRCLNDDGLFCQWLPLHQLDPPTLRIIVRTFLEVYSGAEAYLLHFNVDIPVLGLVGGRGRTGLDPAGIEQRLNANPDLRTAARAVGLDKAIPVLGCFAGGPETLRRYARDAVVATDANPAVLFAAPRHAARRQAASYETLLDWLGAATSVSAELLEAPAVRSQPEFARTAARYIEARNIYLRGLVREAAGDLAGAIDLYLESSGRSLYFTPAYARMVTIIQVMAQADRRRAESLWDRLEQARPDQPLGRRLLAPLFEPGHAPPTPGLKP